MTEYKFLRVHKDVHNMLQEVRKKAEDEKGVHISVNTLLKALLKDLTKEMYT